jgi:hypothetical protein
MSKKGKNDTNMRDSSNKEELKAGIQHPAILRSSASRDQDHVMASDSNQDQIQRVRAFNERMEEQTTSIRPFNVDPLNEESKADQIHNEMESRRKNWL